MGKRIIISNADFSANAIPVAIAVDGTTVRQYVYVANTAYPSSDFDWESHKIEIQVKEDGCIANFKLPLNTSAIPFFFCGATGLNEWLKEIDLSYFSNFPLISFKEMLVGCRALEQIKIGGKFLSLSGSYAVREMVYDCKKLDKVIIDDSFGAPNLNDLGYMFYNSNIRTIEGLENIIRSTVDNLNYMFANCEIKEIDVSGCDTSSVTNFTGMFLGSPINKIIGINGLNTTKVLSFKDMFKASTNIGALDISNWDIAVGAITTSMFLSAGLYKLNANCFTALYGNISEMFYMNGWNTINLDNLNDISAVTESTDLFSPYVIGVPKVTIANVTNQNVKTLLINALNARTVGGSTNWHEASVDGILCLIP